MLLNAARTPRRTPGDTYLHRPVVEISAEFNTAPRQLISRWLIIFWDLRPSHVTRLDLSFFFFWKSDNQCALISKIYLKDEPEFMQRFFFSSPVSYKNTFYHPLSYLLFFYAIYTSFFGMLWS